MLGWSPASQRHNFTTAQLHNYTASQLHSFTTTQLNNCTTSQPCPQQILDAGMESSFTERDSSSLAFASLQLWGEKGGRNCLDSTSSSIASPSSSFSSPSSSFSSTSSSFLCHHYLPFLFHHQIRHYNHENQGAEEGEAHRIDSDANGT